MYLDIHHHIKRTYLPYQPRLQADMYSSSTSVARPSLPAPAPDGVWLSRYSFTVLPPETSSAYPVNLLMSQVMKSDIQIEEKLTPALVSFSRLWTQVRTRFSLNGPVSQYQLRYHTLDSGTTCGLLDDQDLQDCVQAHVAVERREIQLKVLDFTLESKQSLPPSVRGIYWY